MQHFLPRTLPEGLEALTELALDLRWTWSHAGDALWRRLDAELWERTRNPWAILQNAPQQRLETLNTDPVFHDEFRRVIEERKQYMREAGWCAKNHPDFGGRTVACFSMEFGLSEAFPLDAGGLGMLAGGLLKTASDLGAPVVVVSLLYQEGYFRQMFDASGRQWEAYLPPDANTLLCVMDQCLRSRNLVNVIVTGKQPELQWLSMDAAIKHCTAGAGIWEWASNDRGAEPDVVMACAGDVPTLETLAAVDSLRRYAPDLKVRVINVFDLTTLPPPEEHPHPLSVFFLKTLRPPRSQ